MNAPAKLDELLARLESMPVELEAAAAAIDEASWSANHPDGGFSLVEQAWHLADLEREGYAVRIDRLIREDDPLLPDFDGGRVAVQRNYKSRSLAEGIESFAAARNANLSRLRSLSPSDWDRSGIQEGVGRVTLADIPRSMRDHDDSHRSEIDTLRTHFAP
jgi:DinB superfamily